MVSNVTLNLSKLEYSWLEKFSDELEATEYIKKLIDIGKIVYNLTKYSINFDNDIFFPIKNEMNKISLENQNQAKIINNDIINSMDDLKESINKIIGSSNNASLKGKIGENIIEEIIHSNFPDDILVNTSKKARESDYQFITNNETILIEIKTYSENVGTSQIEKFKTDMKRCGHKLGIFYSSTSGIVGIKNRLHLYKINNFQSILFVPNGGLESANIIYCISFCKILLQNNYNHNCLIDIDLLQKYLEEFHDTYADISKISFEINKSKKSIENILEDLYRQSIDLELKSKYLIEDSSKKLRKIIVKNDKLNSVNPLISNFIEILRINNDPRLLNLVNLIKILELNHFHLDCVEGKTEMDKLLIIKNEKIIAEIKICKTKMNIIFKEQHINILLNKDTLKYIEILLNEI